MDAPLCGTGEGVRVIPAGQAQAGDCIRLPNGELRTVVSVISAGELVEAIVERQIATYTPNFMRDSITSTCALYGGGDTTGRERRDLARSRRRAMKPIRLVKETV
jgi:hypothetical protein